MELVDMPHLGCGAERRESSSLSLGTTGPVMKLVARATLKLLWAEVPVLVRIQSGSH